MTGGSRFDFDHDAIVYIDTTEIMVSEETGWNIIQEASLPHSMSMSGSISINNKIFLIGNVCCEN